MKKRRGRGSDEGGGGKIQLLYTSLIIMAKFLNRFSASEEKSFESEFYEILMCKYIY